MSWSGFEMNLHLGNAAMQSDGDVVRALRDVADRIEQRFGESHDGRHVIFDVNGNTVGNWRLVLPALIDMDADAAESWGENDGEVYRIT